MEEVKQQLITNAAMADATKTMAQGFLLAMEAVENVPSLPEEKRALIAESKDWITKVKNNPFDTKAILQGLTISLKKLLWQNCHLSSCNNWTVETQCKVFIWDADTGHYRAFCKWSCFSEYLSWMSTSHVHWNVIILKTEDSAGEAPQYTSDLFSAFNWQK